MISNYNKDVNLIYKTWNKFKKKEIYYKKNNFKLNNLYDLIIIFIL
jgi:hypothetical protein